MSLAAMLQRALSDELCRQGQAGLVVWYDPGGTLNSIVERAMPEGAKLLSFEGSYLALRFALETEDPNFEKRWVVYIPYAPPKESWLRDWELLGTRWELDLLQLLHRQVDLPLTPKLTRVIRGHWENARELAQAWESLIGGQTVNETTLLDALLALGFGLPRWQMEEAILLFVSGAVSRDSLSERGMWAVFRERIAEWTGWDETPDDNETLCKRLEAAVLLSELAVSLPELSRRFTDVLPAEPKRPLVANLARIWRDRENLREAYLRAAERVEREYELATNLTAHEALLNLDTFPILDDLWRREVQNAVAPDGANFQEKVKHIAKLAEQRSSSFWVREGRATYWTPIALAARLTEGCRQAVEEAERISKVSEFVSRYTAEDGWWRLDLWTLELAAKTQVLGAEERSRFVYPAWRAYGSYLDRISRRFAEAVQQDGWAPAQTQFWQRFVTRERRTAVFLVDALRYDLAQRLKSLLADKQFEITLKAFLGTLPTVTEVGMAAVLPNAEAGLEVDATEERLRVRLGGIDVTGQGGRQAWLKNQLGRRARIVRLDELDRTNVEDAALVVVLSREIDEFGTFAADLNPEGLLAMVEQVGRGMHHLREQGFEQFLVTADHGFLFLPPGVEVGKLEVPPAKICKGRFALGSTGEGCIVKGTEELKLSGSEVFAFPIGLTVFAISGETRAFLHGGISLQESIVPVLEARAAATWQKISVIMDLPAQVTSRIASIRVLAHEKTLFDQPRRVVVEVNGRRSEAKELSVNRREEIFSVIWLNFDESPPQHVTFRLLDVDNGQVLQEATMPVKMAL